MSVFRSNMRVFLAHRKALIVISLALGPSMACDAVKAQDIIVSSGGAAQHRVLFHNTEHKQFDHTVKNFAQNYFLPDGARLVDVDQRYTRREHLVTFPDAPAAPRLNYILRNGDITYDINKAAGVRISARLESGPRVKLIEFPARPDPSYTRFEGILEGTITLRYVEAGASGGGQNSRRTEFVTSGGSRFVKGSGTDWMEFRATGPSSRFKEVRRTADEIELFDARRVMYVKLTTTQGLWRTASSENWKAWPGSDGKWITGEQRLGLGVPQDNPQHEAVDDMPRNGLFKPSRNGLPSGKPGHAAKRVPGFGGGMFRKNDSDSQFRGFSRRFYPRAR